MCVESRNIVLLNLSVGKQWRCRHREQTMGTWWEGEYGMNLRVVSKYIHWKWKWSHSVGSDSLQPMDCSLPGSSVSRVFQARVLEWVAISFSRGSSRPRDWTQVSRIVGRRFTVWTTREAPTYTLPSVKLDSHWEFAVCLRELKPGLCNNLEMWDGEAGGREVQNGEDICTPMADSWWCMAKTSTIL